MERILKLSCILFIDADSCVSMNMWGLTPEFTVRRVLRSIFKGKRLY